MDRRILAACRLLMEVALSQMGEAESNLVDTEGDAASNPQFDTEAFERLRQGENMDVPPVRAAVRPQESETAGSGQKKELPPAEPPVHAIHWYAESKATAVGDTPGAPEQTDSMRAISEYFERDARRYGN